MGGSEGTPKKSTINKEVDSSSSSSSSTDGDKNSKTTSDESNSSSNKQRPRFKRISSKVSAASKLMGCATTCSNDCGKQVESLTGIDVAEYATKCNMDCTKKC